MTLTMSPAVRKLVLSLHLSCSLGWVGAVFAYLGLGVSAVTTDDAEAVRAAWIAMDLTGWFVIVPLALGAFLTGVLMALGTPWGLFNHYWVAISFALTIFCTVVLLLHMPTVSALADDARTAEDTHLFGFGGDLLHPTLGLVLLLLITLLNVYKPQGLTPVGLRRQRVQRTVR